MHNFFADFETYWAVKYSLRTQGMSYTDFVNNEQWQCHGCAFKLGDEEIWFVVGPTVRTMFERLKQMQQDGEKIRMICHNVLFDGIVAYIKYGFVADEYFCTLAMVDAMYQGAVGRGLDECMKTLLGWKVGKDDIMKKLKGVRTEDITPEQWEKLEHYAKEDLRATIELYKIYAPHLPEQEHQIMNIILQMFCNPTLVFNQTVLAEAVAEADADRVARIAAALTFGATIEELKGNTTYPKLLERLGIKLPMKPSPSVQGKLIPALAKTDPAFQQMLESKNPVVKALAEARLAVKSTQATTRAYRFKKLHEDMRCFPVAYNYARAHTWRVSGANKINPANLKRGSKLRTCIEAPEGYRLGVADASQIECRGNGYLAGQDSLLELFRQKRDPYNDMASTIFTRPIDRKGNPSHFFEGFLGKTATLGLGFGMGGPKFKRTVERDAKVNLNLDIDFDINEANRIVYDVYRPKNWKIANFWNTCTDMLFAMVNNTSMYHDYGDDSLWIDGKNNKIFFPNGTWLYYAGLSWDGKSFTYLVKRGQGWKVKYIYGALLDENIVQKFARDITSHHMTQIAERYRVVLHTYDENVALIPDKEADEGTEWMINLMKIPPAWAKSIPLDAEGGHAREYSK
jgi:DNA polymerase